MDLLYSMIWAHHSDVVLGCLVHSLLYIQDSDLSRALVHEHLLLSLIVLAIILVSVMQGDRDEPIVIHVLDCIDRAVGY